MACDHPPGLGRDESRPDIQTGSRLNQSLARNELLPLYLLEVVERLDRAATLLTGAQAGRFNSSEAEIGAIALIDSALLKLEIHREELLLAEARVVT